MILLTPEKEESIRKMYRSETENLLLAEIGKLRLRVEELNDGSKGITYQTNLEHERDELLAAIERIKIDRDQVQKQYFEKFNKVNELLRKIEMLRSDLATANHRVGNLREILHEELCSKSVIFKDCEDCNA